MRVLLISNRPPATTRKPGSPRQYNLCKQLAYNHDVQLAFFERDPEREREFRGGRTPAKVFSQIHRYIGDGRRREPSWLARQLHRFRMEPSFSMKYRQKEELELRRAFISDLIKTIQPNLLLVDGVQNWQYVPVECKIPKVVDFCDCLTHLLTQQAKYEPTLGKKIGIYLESYAVMHAELEALKGSDLALAISPEDEVALRRIHKSANTLLVPNGINSRYFSCPSERQKPRDPNKIIFTGVMGYRPNEDAAIHFAESVFPLIQEKEPKAEFWIVGARPTPEVKALGKLKGVYVTGAVADIRPFLEESGVFVSPLRIGAGVKNKILSAWAMEIPVVATSVSMAGLYGTHEQHYIGANSDQEIAEAVCNVISNSSISKMLVREARTLVRERYTWSEPGTILEDRLIHLNAQMHS